MLHVHHASAYLQDPKFSTQAHAGKVLPLIGTLSSGIMYCSGTFVSICGNVVQRSTIGPFVNRFTSTFPYYRRYCLWLGAIVACLSLLGASFATTVSIFYASFYFKLFSNRLINLSLCKGSSTPLVEVSNPNYDLAC